MKLKHCFHTYEKLSGLFCIENGFAKYFTKCYNLFKYFVKYFFLLNTFLNTLQ